MIIMFFIGPLLKEILIRMKDDKSRRKTYLYSAHDTTLVNALRTMGFTNELFKPDYGATLIFELHSIIAGQSEEIKVFGFVSLSKNPRQNPYCSFQK